VTDRHLLHDARDDGEALDLLRAAVSTPSVTGDEAAYAHLVAAQLRADAVDVRIDEFAPGRANVWARWGGGDVDEGAASARHRGILFAGHLDTVHVRGWEEHWAGTERESPFSAAIVDGAVWGRGVGDLKAGISAVVAALRLIRRAGLEPVAPVTFLGVADEESGEEGSGTSEGMRRALAEGRAGRIDLAADFAVYVEPTTLQVYAAHMGFFIAEIRLQGKTAYFGTPELGVDALRAAEQVLAALYRYDSVLRAAAPAELIGSPFVLTTGITSGGYIAVPGDAHISVIRKLVPGEDLGAARDDLDRVVRDAVGDPRIVVDIDYPAGRDHPVGGTPFVTDPSVGPIRTLQAAVREVRADRGAIEAAPYWSEGPFLTKELGVPTVYCAPGDIRNCHTFDEHVDIDEYLSAVTIYATLIADFCGLRRASRP
jgi:acetylornithine deacetylase